MTHQVIRRTRKGIEPIVAAILLIAIAIISAVLIYLWISKLIAQQTSTSNGGVSPGARVLSVSYIPSSSQPQVVLYVQAPTKPNVESASIVAVNGTIVQVVPSSNIDVSTTQASDVYKIVLNVGALSPGVYYCQLYTTDYGIIVSPSFGVS